MSIVNSLRYPQNLKVYFDSKLTPYNEWSRVEEIWLDAKLYKNETDMLT